MTSTTDTTSVRRWDEARKTWGPWITAAGAAEGDCRDFARQYPTPNVLEAVRLCETGRLRWTQVADLFARSLAAGVDAVR